MKIKKHLHPDDVALWHFVEKVVYRLAHDYCLKLGGVRPVKRRKTASIHGFCSKKGVVSIAVRTFRKGRWERKPELAYQIADTIAHEVAHLRHNNHRTAWFRLYASMLATVAGGRTYSTLRRLTK